MNGKGGDILKSELRTNGAAGVLVNNNGPSDREAAAREYNAAIVFTDNQLIDANGVITRNIHDSWNGEVWYTLYTDDCGTPGVSPREVLTFEGFHEVKGTGGAQISANFGSGITYKEA